MQKFCAIFLLIALVAKYEALPQTKWSRPIPNGQGQLTRERRQFPFGDWIPLNKPCPTCRTLIDPLDIAQRAADIGLTPPRPPTVTRQVQGEGNFFPRDESSILSVPPPPPGALRQGSNGNFQNFRFQGFPQQFSNPAPIVNKQVFPQNQQVQFLQQPFVTNQNVLVNSNQQSFPVLNNVEFTKQKATENIVLQQNQSGRKLPFSSKSPPFASQQQQIQQAFIQQPQQQSFIHHQQQGLSQQQQQKAFAQQPQQQALVQQRPLQQQQSINFDSILTPPPVANATAQSIVIPGLDKEEVQLLYVPVETLKHRGTLQQQQQQQQHIITQQQQNFQFPSRQVSQQQTVKSVRPTDATITTSSTTKLLPGSFVTSQRETLSTVKVSVPQPFSTASTPSTVFFQSFPLQQTPQPFVSATPIVSTPSPFVTQSPFVTNSPFSQTFSTLTPTTLSHFPTLQNSVQFRQHETQFGTTPKTLISEEGLREEIITGKPQFESLQVHQLPFTQDQSHVLLTTGQQNDKNPIRTTAEIQTELPEHQFQNQHLLLKSQQEQQLLLQQQKEKELREEYLLKQRHQKELESQRLQELQRLKELEQQAFLLKQKKQKELEEQKLLEEQRQKKIKQVLQEQKRQKELEEQQKLLQQKKQKELELERERYLQQQRQKEIERERFLQQQKQKEIERERFLQQQKQKEIEIEQERYLQEQRQREMEEQLKINRLKELEERRILQQQQKEQEKQRLLLLQQQKEFEEQRLLQEQQQRLRQQQDEQLNLLHHPNSQRQNLENVQKHQNFQFTQQQDFNQHITEHPNKHVFSDTDNSNLISQAEKETDPETLVPHQPPLSVFFKGDHNTQPKIVDVLRELRGSQTIIVLDQYFETMPKVFVGPAGLKPPLGYGKFDLPYLSNLDNSDEVKIDKIPFFVAPLNFVPPPGYSKIPFPSPHVGSVVVSSESNPGMNLKTIGSSASVEGNDDVKNIAPVGPELPGLINGLEKQVTTTIRPTTSSLPQTTAQLRNRRPNNNLYRSRKPPTKVRSTTTPKPEETTQKPQKEESEGGFRKTFNRFLKRRRPTTTTTTTESPQEKEAENKQYFFQVQHRKRTRVQPNSPVTEQKINGQNENQGFEKTSLGDQGHVDYRYNPNLYKIQSNNDKFKKQSFQIPEYPEINNIQTFEDGPIPTGSAKSITQEVYTPNELSKTNIQKQEDSQTKFQPKVDTTQSSEQIFDKPKPTTFFEDFAVNPTALYVETTAGKIATADYLTLTPKTESNDNVIPTSLPPSFNKPENSYVPQSSPAPLEQHPTTENAFLDDRFTVAFAEISKHYNIPNPQEPSKKYESEYTNVQPTSEISLALQAPFAESLSQEQQSQELVTLEEVKPTNSITNLENVNVPVLASKEEFSDIHLQNEYKSQQNFNGTANEVKPAVSEAFSNQHYDTDQSTLGYVAEREQPVASFGNSENFYTSSSPTSPLEQYYLTSIKVPNEDYISVNNKSQNQEIYYPTTFKTLRVSEEATPTPSLNYGQEVISHNEKFSNENLPKIEDYGQIGEDISSTTQGSKFSNPSIVKVRTRYRGRQRGNVNFAASQLTTSAPVVRTKPKIQYDESDQEYVTKPNSLRNYNPVKTSKFNGYRGLKKPISSTTNYAQTIEPTTAYEQKTNVYTIRPQKRPSNPSTVSTKRIRRPTSPLPTLETSTENFGYSTSGYYSHKVVDNQEYPSSGVSNDVYYEHANYSPVRQKLKKNQNLYEQAELKTSTVPSYIFTTYSPVVQNYPATLQAHLPTIHETYNQNDEVIRQLAQEKAPETSSERYLDSNLSESGIDISGIILTTLRTTAEEESPKTEIPKKSQESKKAIDPDLEKKNGRRRIRVRVHKRPHENFETAESQNLRTVANVLTPPTSTYKPNDESNIHQLAKNTNAPFGVRSREYFKKKLNLTHLDEIDVAKSREDSLETNSKTNENSSGEAKGEGALGEHKIKGYFGKVQRKENEFNGHHATENIPSGPGNEKVSRTKVRGFVRKIKKHGGLQKNSTTPISVTEDDDGDVKQENIESHSRQHLKINYGGLHQNGRFNGTRHRTIVKYIKKNRFRTSENESHESEIGKGEEEHGVTESHSSQVEEEKRHEEDVNTAKLANNEEEFQTTVKNNDAEAIFTTLRNEAQHDQEMETDVSQSSTTEHSKLSENVEKYQTTQSADLNVHSTDHREALSSQRSDTIQSKPQVDQTEQLEIGQTEAAYIPNTQSIETEKVSTSEESSKTSEEFHPKETEASSSTSSTQTTELKITNKPKPFQSFRPFYQRTPSSGFIRTREPLSSTTEHFKPEPNERRFGLNRHKYEKNSSRREEKLEDKKTGEIDERHSTVKNSFIPEIRKDKKTVEHVERHSAVKNSFTPEIRKYSKNKSRESSFSSFSKSRYTTPGRVETISEISDKQENEFSEKQPETTITEVEKTTKNDPEFQVSTKIEHTSSEDRTLSASTETIETTNDEHTIDSQITTTAISTEAESSEEDEEENEKEFSSEEVSVSTEGHSELPATLIQTSSYEEKATTTESVTEITTTEKSETYNPATQPNLYVFGKGTFSFDEAEKFTGTKNRAYVRNITADILENTAILNTAHFSAPGIDKQNEIRSETLSSDTPTTTDINNKIGDNEKTEETATELTSVETTTVFPSTKKAVVTDAVTKPKIAKLVKTSTTTKISHETEICYRGKCIRTKSENPDEDLKLLVDSANISLEKNKT